MPAFAYAAAVALAGALIGLIGGASRFAPGACERLDPYLRAHVLGQPLALRQAADAVCDHLGAPPRGGGGAKPLVLSLHGPPGVGKSLFHARLAQALYSAAPRPDAPRCPGADCAGYRVLYGMDYGPGDAPRQRAALRAALEAHAAAAPEALLVVEEYDKLDCGMRAFFRSLLERGRAGNATLGRAVVVLESNAGYVELHAMLAAAGGDRDRLSPEAAQRALKDLVFSKWVAQGCEERADTLKMLSLVDFFLPFFPLDRGHVEALFERRLAARAAELAAAGLGRLSWGPEVVAFLADRVDYEGGHPIEGAKEVATLATRYASRPLREWEAAQRAATEAAKAEAKAEAARRKREKKKDARGGGKAAAGAAAAGGPASAGAPRAGRLKITADGRGLVVEPEAPAGAAVS